MSVETFNAVGVSKIEISFFFPLSIILKIQKKPKELLLLVKFSTISFFNIKFNKIDRFSASFPTLRLTPAKQLCVLAVFLLLPMVSSILKSIITISKFTLAWRRERCLHEKNFITLCDFQ